jgi:hypothetical protein
MRSWLLNVWRNLVVSIDDLIGRYLYVIPAVMASVLIFIVVFLVISLFVAADDMDRSIKSIPKVVQVEMEKTRETLIKEGNTNRDVIIGQHEATRDELQKRMDDAELKFQETKAALDRLQKGQAEAKKKLENPSQAPAKRQKVLGIF